MGEAVRLEARNILYDVSRLVLPRVSDDITRGHLEVLHAESMNHLHSVSARLRGICEVGSFVMAGQSGNHGCSSPRRSLILHSERLRFLKLGHLCQLPEGLLCIDRESYTASNDKYVAISHVWRIRDTV